MKGVDTAPTSMTLWMLSMFLIIAIVGVTGFNFNMTADLEKETRLLNACITFGLELDECDQIYGGIPK